MPLFYKWALVLFVSLMPLSAYCQGDSTATCSSCCCYNSLAPAGIMISHVHEKNQWMISYRYMTTGMGNIQMGSNEVSDNYLFNSGYSMSSNKMRMDMHMLMAMYGLTDKLTLMAMFNYNVTNMDMTMLAGTSHMHMPGMNMSNDMDMHMKTSGLGDTRLSALYSLLDTPTHHILVSAGFSIPTGSINIQGNANSMYPNQRLPYSMQQGSGTWDILPLINYIYHKDLISWSSQVSSVLRTGYNANGYKLGNELTWNNWFAYKWHRLFSSSVRLEGNVLGAIKGHDPQFNYYKWEPSTNPNNYGGQRMSAFIGTNLYLNRLLNSKIGLEYGIPLYQNLNGPQMKMNSSLFASWSITF